MASNICGLQIIQKTLRYLLGRLISTLALWDFSPGYAQEAACRERSLGLDPNGLKSPSNGVSRLFLAF